MTTPNPIDWPVAIFNALRDYDVRQVYHVPDAGHAQLITLCEAEPSMRTIVLTAEHEGIALACGAWLGGVRSALLMQSSGVGQCVNALAMVAACGFPLFTIVTMRGEWGEFNPWQVPMGRATQPVLESMGLTVHRVNDASQAAPTVAAGLKLAYQSSLAVAVLLGQQMIGAKTFGK
ncbi:MAG: phosphonopyruvate decarboxylase [Chloroflexi bacterium]|nr:phosphonopyruvate decarboxylase [Chloroflexota bacterium]